jgi:hypothetical protein
VVDDQRHPAALPFLTLAAQLARAFLEPLGVQAFLQRPSAVRRVLDEHVLERNRRTPPRDASRGGIEVSRRDGPDPHVLLERHVVAARRSHAQAAQCL